MASGLKKAVALSRIAGGHGGFWDVLSGPMQDSRVSCCVSLAESPALLGVTRI